MTISVFNLFSIGIGPSSSHTVGPMKAARAFILELQEQHQLNQIQRLQTELFGSLAFTGKGHGTDAAILLGLEGEAPDTVNPEQMRPRTHHITQEKKICLAGTHLIHFDADNDLLFNFKDLLPAHTNGMRFTAYANTQQVVASKIYYSIGGGFIVDEQQAMQTQIIPPSSFPYPFQNAKTLLNLCEKNHLSIREIMLANECSLRTEADVKTGLLHIAHIMRECIDKGSHASGILPGGLQIKRRAPELFKKLQQKGKPKSHEFTDSMEWLNLYAIAVNEENAAGGRVVTAPTNGAAGIIPAVL